MFLVTLYSLNLGLVMISNCKADYKIVFILGLLGLLFYDVNAAPSCYQFCDIGDTRYEGHCGAFQEKSDRWCVDSSNDEYCCAQSSSDCCDPDAGAIAGLVIGIVVALICCIYGCYSCCCKKPARPSLNPNSNPNQSSSRPNPMYANNVPSSSDYEMFTVTIPSGISSGMKFKISANGEEMEVVCPPGSVAGQTINVEVPKPASVPSNNQKFAVVVPNGISPGMNFKVNANGQDYEVTCPPGAVAGQQIEIFVDTAPKIPVATPI